MEANGDPPTSPQPERTTPGTLLRLLTSSDSDDNVQALNMIEEDPSIYTSVSPAQLKGAFTRCLLVADVALLRPEARRAFIALAGHVRRIRDTEMINTLFAPIARTLISDLPMERKIGGRCLMTLIELTAALPEVIRPHIGTVISLCHQVVHSDEIKECYRQVAICLLSALCQQAMDAIPDDRLPDIVASCLAMMVNVDDDISLWLAGTDIRSEEAESGKDALRIIVAALFETTIVPVTLQLTDVLLQDSVWRLRHGALHTLEILATTGRVVMTDRILSSAMPALKDEASLSKHNFHPRVRQQACVIFKAMSGSLGPSLDQRCLQEVVPALVTIMADTSTPRVAYSAAQALESFISGSCAEIVSNHIDLINAFERSFEDVARMTLLSPWHHLLVFSQLDIVDSLASISITNGSQTAKETTLLITPELFDTIYDRLIDSIKRILRARDDSFTLLRVSALKCLTQMNRAVAKDKYLNDADDVLQSCAILLGSMRSNDSEFLFALKGYCNSLGDGCGPFLPLLMPLLLQKAICPAYVPGTSRNDFLLLDCSSRIALYTIDDFAKILGEKFAPYVNDVSGVILHNLTTLEIACNGLPRLINCIKHKGLPAMRALWLTHWNALKTAFKDRNKRELYGEWLSVVADSIALLGSEGVTSTDVREMGEVMKEVLQGSDDFVSKSIDEEEDAAILSHTSKLVTSLLKTIGANSFATIHTLMPLVFLKMGNSEDGIRTIMKYIEHAPDMAFIYHETIFYDLLLGSQVEERAGQRWVGAWALGHIALLKLAQWAPLVTHTLPLLAAVIGRSDSRESDECIGATENAISAVIKIIKHCEGVDMNEWLPCFVDWILLHGIREDTTQIGPVYGFLAELIENDHPLVIGEDKANWAKLVRNLVQTLHRISPDETANSVSLRLVLIIRSMKLEDDRLFYECVADASFDTAEMRTLAIVLS